MSTDGPAYMAKTHDCPDCGQHSNLVVRWNGKADECWCPRCKRTDGFRRRESLTAQWRRAPESIPVQIADKLERKYGKPMTEQAVTQSTETAMVKRIESALWLAELKPQDRQSLAHLAVKYGLDPLMKELTLYEGSPYISIAGLIRIAHRQKMFAGLEDRPMSTEERQQYGYKAPLCWLVKVYRKDWKCAATGTGTADPANPFRNNPIERIRPEWMARSRAIRQALKLAFPHSLPFEEVDSAEERGIDPETGEILDHEYPKIVTVDVSLPVEPGEPVATAVNAVPVTDDWDDRADDYTEEGILPPGELTASPIPEAQDEPAMVEDARRRVLALAEQRGWDPLQNHYKFKTRFYADEHVEFDLASLDTLNEWCERLARALAKAGK